MQEEVEKHGPFDVVVEIGSRDINGSVRDLFPSSSYTGLDLYEGPGVDWVGSAVHYEPDGPVDCVVCCEVLEHTPDWDLLIHVAAGWLRPKGRLIVTCAAPNRPAHSGITGAWVLEDGEYYAGLSTRDVGGSLLDAGIVATTKQVHRDIQSSGWKQ